MLRPLVAGLAIWPLLAGCAGHSATMRDVRDALARNDLEEARARLAEAGRGTGNLLFALEDGLLLHYIGDFELSNLRFEFAEQRVDDLYTKSISRAVLSLVTSDLILRFEPRGIENFLVNYYRSLNYSWLSEPEETLVEWRKLASKLQFSRLHGQGGYYDPPFFHYLVGLGLEVDDPANAYVSLRLADAGYRDEGRPPPPGLVDDLVRLATYLGFADHLEEYEQRYGGLAGENASSGAGAGGGRGTSGGQPRGELVVLVEEGFVAPIEEINAYIPIIEVRRDRATSEDEEERFDLALTLAQEYSDGKYHGYSERDKKKVGIAYILPLAFPTPGQGFAAFDQLEIVVDADTLSADPVLSISQLQMTALEDRLLGIYAKTIVRALVKYAAAEALEEEAEEKTGDVGGDVVGFLANAINLLTERADTRAWLGLPHRIWVARFRLPPGHHDVSLIVQGSQMVPLGPVQIRSGQRSFLSHRVF